MAAPAWMTSSPPVRSSFDWRNLGLRVASAVVLGLAAFWAVRLGGAWFLGILCVAAAVLAVEWGGMSTPATPIRTSVAVGVCILLALAAGYLERPLFGLAVLAACTVVATLALRSVTRRIGDVPFGAAYIGVPALAMLWLRQGEQGFAWTLLLFVVTWSADIAAFGVGSTLKGPKLRPAFSPNKTWSGFLGGLVFATLATMLAARLLGLPTPLGWAAAIGFVGGFATMAGDLWESWLKRRFGVKDSSDLIPGHGGLLDRVDGLLFAVAAVAAARWLWQSGALA